MTPLVLAIDQGTTGSTAALFKVDTLEIVANCKVEFPQHYPAPGLVEHDATEIWQSVLKALAKVWEYCASKKPEFKPTDITAIGVTNQRETVVPWHRDTGELAGKAIVWQDRRTAEFCSELKSSSERTRILQSTGLVCDPYFSASKMRWMLKNYPRAAEWAKAGKLVLGTMDAYVIYKLSGGKVIATDHTNACRTMLYDLKKGDYEPGLLELFSVPQSSLPEIKPSLGKFGVTHRVTGLPDGIPISGCIGDQQSALYGQHCEKPGEAKVTFGTGAFLLCHSGSTPHISDTGLLTSVALATPSSRTFAVEGSAFIAGAAVQFLRDNFKWFKESSECEKLASLDPRDPNLIFVPALAGLAAPYWNPDARGALLGLTRGSSQSQITRAVLESITLQNVQLLRLMADVAATKLTKIAVDGGASRNDHLMQFQADLMQLKLVRPANIETTSAGAAKAAVLGLTPTHTFKTVGGSTEFTPKIPAAEANTITEQWLRGVEWLNRFYSF